ncbi:DC-STAMP domain-containing protein 2 [Thunnus maccoyii]|uniref:DC-STAMP domain-containing protein 2 n=1 Tax=Thunnus maccoyii TaxID=8240 RepID=UPI001C4C6E0F|nr:DC-STAMP domain-containing protein 2 [Thunnus maccoyii]XP_042279022.1 DC-STAMP domain-containing protein 2 [Thunnus maccoyii]XP_042279023.1 DC-STAMP domain-containing protein 2 [Thunnus maccoyii]
MKAEVRVQLGGGGVTALTRSAGHRRLSGRGKVRGHLMEAGRSLVAFVCGLLLASLYGVMMLFLQKQPLWLCVYSTLAVAFMAAFGMGLSADIRADIMVMLPSLCSAQGRSFLLFLSVSLLLAAPLSNTLENTERAAASLLCGAELAANQTQELLQRAATPLFSVLDRIIEISSNAVLVAGRVHNLIHALTDSVRHVARTLRNVLHFLVDIGDVCNAKLGSPYRKCRAVFAEARADCSDLLGEFNFLCDIIDGFLPLCQLARVGELFCIIPSYIASVLKTRLAAPTIAAFEQMKREFNFNISASVTFDLDANSSRSLQQVTQDIMEEVSSELQVFQKLSKPLAYGGLVLLACSFLRAVRYRRRYLYDIDFDNVYISAQFEELDQQVTAGGGASVLPITRREAKTYITPLAWQLTDRERQVVLVGVASVLRHMVIGGLLVMLDFVVFWMLDQVHHQVKEDVVARAPVAVAVQVNGSGYASDIFRDLVASFNILQGGNVTVISRKCLLSPSEPDQSACFILGILLGLALLVSLSGGFMQRCRRLVCSSYHPEREQERIQFLHQLILDQRRTVGKALRRSAYRSRGGGGGGGGRRGGGHFETLMLRLPGGPHLCDLLGLSSVSCRACGEGAWPEEDNTVICDVPQCPGVYCRPCFHSLGNTCVVCVRPQTFQEDGEEELDSSDDEQQSLTSALNSTRITEPSSLMLMKRRVSMATRRRLSERSESHMRAKDGERDSSSEISEADMTDQDRPGSDESDSGASFHSASSPLPGSLQEQSLTTVLIHRPDCPQLLQESPGASRTPQDPAGPSRTLQDPPEPPRTHQDPPGPFRTLKQGHLWV